MKKSGFLGGFPSKSRLRGSHAPLGDFQDMDGVCSANEIDEFSLEEQIMDVQTTQVRPENSSQLLRECLICLGCR